jgi:hypothetical protein
VEDPAFVVVAAAAVAFVEGILAVAVVVAAAAAAFVEGILAVAVVVAAAVEEVALFAVAVVIRMDEEGIPQGVDVVRDSAVVVVVGAADRVVVGVAVVVEVVVGRVQDRHRVGRQARVVEVLVLVQEGSSLLL